MLELLNLKEKFPKKEKYFSITYNKIIILLLILLNLTLCAEKNEIENKITLKIEKNGTNIKIYSSSFNEKPTKININGKLADITKNVFNFTTYNNTIDLIWDYALTNCFKLFYECNYISIIDLSNFDTSNVTNMGYMFYNCESLTSLNLFNINTTQVKNMAYMFSGCTLLNSIDLSFFNTSNVEDMSYMFRKNIYFYHEYFIENEINLIKNNSITSLNLSNFDTSKVTSMMGMFYNCYSLISLNLSNFNTSQVEIMSYMFHGCLSLKYLNLSNFNTSSVTNMDRMFGMFEDIDISHYIYKYEYYGNWSSLVSLDISNFDTSQVINMRCMFCACDSLLSLNLSNFNTSKVIHMDYMFSGCSSLTSLDLSNFDISKVDSLRYMFFRCKLLTSLNLSNFITSYVNFMDYMFAYCESLEYLNLKNFHKINVGVDLNMFTGIPQNVVICYNNNSNSGMIFKQIKIIKCYIIDCSEDWKSKQKKILSNNNTCIDNCYKDSKYIYEYNTICYENCTGGYLENNICKCELEQCLECPKVALYKSLCTKCNYNYYPIENDPNNLGEYIKCYINPSGYFLNENIYKECYHSCETCDKKGNNINHYCLKCKSNYTFEIKNKNNYLNCYESCKFYYYFDSDYNYHCTKNNYCPEDYDKYIPDKKQCIENCKKDEIYKYEYDKTCHIYSSQNMDIIFETMVKNCEINGKDDNICEIKYDDLNITNKSDIEHIQNIILENIEKNLLSGCYNYYNIDHGKNNIIKTELMTITISNINNQKNISFSNNNLTAINFDECETILKNYYNISNIYIKKIDVTQEQMKIPKIEYDFYAKLNLTKTEKIDKSLCKNTNVVLYYPVKISESENIDEFDTQSGYYNDICYPTKSDEGTDILLDDRIKEFVLKHKTLCQEDCEFKGYNYFFKKAECKCKVANSALSFAEINFNETKLYENIKNVNNIANLDILICTEQLFNIEGLKSNIGFYTIISGVSFEIVSILVFYFKELSMLNQLINDIVFAIKNSNLFKLKKKVNKNKKIIKIKHNYPPKRNYNFLELNMNNKKNKIKNNNASKKIDNKRVKQKRKGINRMVIKKTSINEDQSNEMALKQNPKVDKIIKKINNIMEEREEKLNYMKYNLALEKDQRTYCQYYFSLLRLNYIIAFTFCIKDYNSRIIKIYLLLLNFIIYFTINALFFNNNTMHHIYDKKGSFDLDYELPKIIYSLLISFVFNRLLKLLALSNDNLIKLKNSKLNKSHIEQERKKLNYKLKIKFILFFVISFVVLLICGYYLAMFCAIYKNTQIYLFKEILIGFGFSLIYPFGLYLIPGIFRISSLSNPKGRCLYVYKFSQILQSIL